MRLRIAVVALISFAGGCSSSPEKKDLDVALKPSESKAVATPTTATQAAATDNKPAVPTVAPPDIEWQKFFKAPPTAKERTLLQQKLGAWKDAGTSASLLEKARNHSALGQIAAAETTYRELLRRDGDHGDGALELAQLYLRRNQLERCFELLEQVHAHIDRAEATPREFLFRYKYTLGLAHVARNERPKGHRILSDLIAVDPAFTPGYAALATSYLAINKLAVAEFITRRGMDLGGDDPALFNLMGVMFERKGNTPEARRWFDKALAASDSFAPALVNRAKLAIDRREYEASEADLGKALAIAPAHVEALILTGIVQKRTGRYDAAKHSFGRAIEVNPESAHARYNLGLLLFEHFQEPTTALRLFHEVLQTKDENTEIKALAKAQIESMTERWINQD